MPTECERSVTSPTTVQNNATDFKENLTGFNEHLTVDTMMEGDMSTSQTSTTSNGSSTCNGGRKTSITSPDPTAYVAKARVTRPTPPPPPYNPMQFVQIKPCNLYQTAQEQLKKAEEVKKIKEIRKEEPEDWQNNLDNWKSSRRKRVEHIIDRVVEVKKLELEEHDRTRRKSKTFSEMIEERGERSGGRGLNKLASLAVYAEDEANDLSDLGIGTSSASGKSSLSDDYDNNSVMSDNAAELDKAITNSNHKKPATTESTIREYISSPGYETSSSTAPASSPDPCEYTYEGAIQDYKQRVSRAASGLTSVALTKLTTFNSSQQQQNSKESTPERAAIKETSYPPRRGSKIEDRLMGFEVQSPSEECVEKNKVDVPKIDISKRKEIFEIQDNQNNEPRSQAGINNTGIPRVTLRDRFKVQEATEILTEQPKKELKRLSGDITSIKERLQSLEQQQQQQQQQQNIVNGANKITANKLVDIPVPPLKERLSSLQNAVTKEEVRKPPVKLVDARQLEIMKNEEEKAQQSLKEVKQATEKLVKQPTASISEELEDMNKDDSGIHTADDVELEERQQADIMEKEQELKLNAAIEALAKEEQQLSEAANAVNQIEAEFEELSLGSVSLPLLANSTNANATPITNDHMEYSVSLTNPSQQTKSCSNSYSREINSNSCNRQNNENNGEGQTVKGLDFKSTTTNLRRKPTNEMVHAKNLLKIFKETFQNDIELDEHESKEEIEIKNINSNFNIEPELNIKSQVVERSTTKGLELDHSILPAPIPPLSSSKIPRSMTPLGKPPLSPLAIRSKTKFMTPPGSPISTRKNDSQFSINGRVEIFNSKTMTTSSNKEKLVKPLTPTMTTKKTQLPYINKTNNIGLPDQQQQQQQQLLQATTTKQQKTQQTFTVTEALSTNKKSQQQQQQQYHLQDHEEQIDGKKSKLAQQMVNEPQTNSNHEETNQQHQTDHNKQQQQQTEIVVCAPPITIVNPDELPKPNTVKNLSSCFQQQQNDNSLTKSTPRSFAAKQTPPPSPITNKHHITHTLKMTAEEDKHEESSTVPENKKLLISSVPLVVKQKPPASPVLSRRHICYISGTGREEGNKTSSSSQQQDKELSNIAATSISSSYLASSQQKNPLPFNSLGSLEGLQNREALTAPSLKPPEKQIQKGNKLDNMNDAHKLLATPQNDNTSTSSASNINHQNGEKDGSAQAKEDKDKLSLISTSSTSSSDCTVIDNSKKLSDISSTSKDNKELVSEQPNNLTKTLDPQTTESLIQEFLKAERQASCADQQNESIKGNGLTLLKIDSNPATPKSPTTSNLSSNLTFTPPLQSPTKELFKITTTPLVVSTDPSSSSVDQKTPLAPFKISNPLEDPSSELISPSECPPNESTLYKLASSAPHTPNSDKNLSLDADICKSLLTSMAVTPTVVQRQFTVEEAPCQKVDKTALPFHNATTGFKDITEIDINNCSGIKATSIAKTLKPPTQRQISVVEETCKKIDINNLPNPDDKKQLQVATGFKCVSPTEIRKCDNYAALDTEKCSSSKTNTKPNSPILEARAAHSKALIETCEKIIAEERLASSQLKSSLSSIPQSTPLMQRISKIPKPIASCCKATESLNEADLGNRSIPPEKPGAIARLHVVETQIKVTTTTPPASPKASTKSQSSSQPVKKTKNIFDFLKKNFGHSPKHQEIPQPLNSNGSGGVDTEAETSPILILSEEELKAFDEVKYDEIHKIDNSKFYIATQTINEDSSLPPPLPKTPAPVNIEITRKITTDEILEDGKTEKDLTKEIDDLLDDELNKLNHEIEALEKAGAKN